MINNSQILFQRLKRRLLQYNIWGARIAILAILLGLIVLSFSVFAKPVKNLVDKFLNGPLMVSTFFTDPLYTLPSYDGRTNILFLGMGGGNHDGAKLTDTMIFVSLDLKNTTVTMLSLPRDIWIPSLNAKINAAYMVGEEKSKGGGYTLAEDAVYEIIGQPIHYVVSLDFNGFKNLIDLLGGIEVEVDKSFVDEWYPITGKENDLCDGDPEYRCRYETIRFEKGIQQMNGETALKFSRSRKAEGDEGTDFARAARQQKVIKAIKDKLASSRTFLNPAKLLELKKLASQYVNFDKPISDKEYAGMASFAVSFWRSGKEVKTISLETGDEDNPGFLYNPPMEKYGQWVLVPRDNDWKNFQASFWQKLQEK